MTDTGTTPIDLTLAKQVAGRAELRSASIGYKIARQEYLPDYTYNLQTAAVLAACAGTIDALVSTIETLTAALSANQVR